MSELINAVDKSPSTQIGENGHIEYGWSNNIREKILQFSFQVTRTNDNGVKKLQSILKELLLSLKHSFENGVLVDKEIARGYLSILYRMIGHTRDIIDGKGECVLTYMMIYTWHIFYPELAKFALRCLVDSGNKSIHQYGSWKDIKYFCEYCRNQNDAASYLLIHYAIKITNEQLKKDYDNYSSNATDISLVAKWIPREKSSFGWLYNELARDYFSHYLLTANTDLRLKGATAKCKRDYRKILATINNHIETIQIKQCSQEWSTIDFQKVTSISLSKQKKALLNIKQNGDVRFPKNFDRIDCAKKFTHHVEKVIHGETEINGKQVGMADFTKQALQLIHTPNQIEIDLLNSQWRDNAQKTDELGNMIAMVDISASMQGDPMNAAIALGIRIAEKSILGNRLMTFSANPSWINLEKANDFVSKMNIVKNAEWAMNADFHSALDIILDAIIQNKMPPEDVENLVLVILSDMQMDTPKKCNQILYDSMKVKYACAGLRIHGKPYKPPHILFWNLRSTNGFPSLSNQRNCSMMSGYSSSLLKLFCEQGINALQSCTPWGLLEKSLENSRYKMLNERFCQEMGIMK